MRIIRHNLGFKAPRGIGRLTNPMKGTNNRVYTKISIIPVDRIIIEGRFKVTKLLRGYEQKVIIPQLFALKQAGRILDDSAAM